MADPLAPPSVNPLDALFDEGEQGILAAPKKQPANPLDAIGPDISDGSTAKGAFGRAAARGVLPSIAAFPAMGPGAAAGAALGAFAGPVGAAVGAVGGALVAGFGASVAANAAQDWAIDKLPDTWQEAIGQDERQRKMDETQHGTAAFLGGLLPTVLTMKPGLPSKAVLRENATALERIMSYPATAAVFGGGVMGGMELASQATGDQPINWSHVAVATGVGVVFNKPTRFGERLMGVRRAPGQAHPADTPMEGVGEVAPAATPEAPQTPQTPQERPPGVTEKDWNETILGGRPAPTVFEAADAKVMGPGVTESVFMGTQEQTPAASMTSQQAVRDERVAMGEPAIAPDAQATARQMEPELFDQYEALRAQQDELRRWVNEAAEMGIPPGAIAHLRAVDAEIAEIAPQIAAAHRRASDARGTEVVDPVSRETLPLAEGARPVEEQRDFIARDVEQKLIAAGRPPEEARAAAQLVAARYETRAGRFSGKLGTAQDLYLREGPEIAGADGKIIKTDTPERAREDLVRVINSKASPDVIASHPVVREANAYNDSRPQTSKLPGYGTPEFQAAREFDFGGEKVVGYEPAIDRLTQQAEAYSGGKVAHDREAVLVWGPPASGKSMYSERLAKGRKAAIVDPDDVKKALPEFENGRAGTAVHQESSDISAEVMKRLVEKGANLVLPRVGADLDKARAYVTDLQKKGYAVKVVNMSVEPAEAYRRMIRRFLKTGRVIGSDYFSGVGTAPRENYYTLKKEGIFDEGIDINGNGPPGTAYAVDNPDSPIATILGLRRRDDGRGPEGAGERAGPAAASEPQAETVAAEPVAAAYEAVEKIDSLTPAQQKRELPTYTPERDGDLPHQGKGAPAGVFMFDPVALAVDEQRFQFKSGGDEYGVLPGALRGVTKWDVSKAQTIIVWEQNDGKLFVVDGHQRSGLARRLTAEGKAKDIQMPGILYREVDGISSDYVRALAAAVNIANGSGSAMDGAKVLRARPDLMDGSIPLSVGKGQQAAALAKLGDEPFRMMINEVIPEHYGAIVGDLIPNDPARQLAAINAIARFEPRNVEEASVLTQRVAAAELAKKEEGSQTSMFGDLETAESTAGEEMKIVGRAIADLKKDKALFARVVANAERIEETGSTIQRETAKSVATDAEVFVKTLASDAYAAGALRTELVAAARELKDGKTSVGEAAARILAALRTRAENGVSDGLGNRGRTEPAKEFAQSKDLLDFEPGAEGKPQALIPGVEPVQPKTQGDLIRERASAPLRGGAKGAKEGGLFDFEGQAQKELFQREGFQEYIARVKAERQAFQTEVEAELAERGRYTVESEKYNKTVLLTRNMSADQAPYRVTLLDRDKTPTGHMEFETIQEAADVLRGWRDKPPVEFEQTARGKVRIAEGRKPIITLMKDGNASTFGHESGHVYLEELMRDSYHPDAPTVVRDDAQTVRDWLGVKDPEDIKTKHHEKFARGWEQYLREGVAPSPELAGVFARFKDWLLQIYETLKGLGAPINDDIRGVFDRMLAMEPQRTVVAPEREPTGPTIHDIHETEAREIAVPEEAAPKAMQINAESNRYAAELSPEVKNELDAQIVRLQAEIAELKGGKPGTDTAAEAGGGTGEGRDLEPGSGKPGALTAGGDSGTQSGAVGESGGGAVAESVASRPHVDTGNPLAPRPTDLFGAEQSPHLDKAGNIRLDTLSNVEEVRQAIRDAAEANQDFIGDRRGVVTDGQVMDLARAAGMEGAEKLVRNRVVGQAFSAEEVMTLRLALVQSATTLSATMKKAAIGTDADVLAYAQAKDRHQLLQATAAQATSEAGRALRAFRNITGMTGDALAADKMAREATGKTLFQLRQEARLGATLETPEQVSKFMADSQKRNFGHMMVEYWINGLLSGPTTHTTNIIGNLVLTLQHMGPETAAAAVIGGARRAFGREGERVRIGELGARARGLVEGIPSGIKAAGESFRAGVNMLLPGEQARELPFQHHTELAVRPVLDEAATYTSVMADTFGAVQGMRDGIMAAGAALRAGGEAGSPLFSTQYGHTGAIPDIAVKGVNVLPIGTVARLPGRFLAAADGFFRAVNYSMEKNAIAYRMASEEGLQGTRFDARVADIRQNPTPEMMEGLVEQTSRLTLMDKGGKFLAALSQLSNVEIGGFPALKFVTPFVHVAGNILRQSVVERTPLGLLSPELRADLTGKNGNVAQDMAQARMLVGTGIAVTLGTLAAQGLASGSGPTDPSEAAMWRLAGNQAHSVRIGDTWYSVQKLGPLGMLMSLSADMWDVSKSANEGEFSEAAGHVIHAFSQNILDQSVMKGPADLLRAVNDSDRYGSQYVRNVLSSFVPYSVGMSQLENASDPYSRQARTVIDAIRGKIPGHLDSYFENPLFPKYDIWGRPMTSPDKVSGTGIAYREMSTDPVNMAMVELGVSPAPVQRKIRNEKLTDQQFDDFARIAGVMTKSRLDVIVNSPDWRQWPNYVKTYVINETVRQSRETARGMMMARFPIIVRDATEAKLEKFRD